MKRGNLLPSDLKQSGKTDEIFIDLEDINGIESTYGKEGSEIVIALHKQIEELKIKKESLKSEII